MHLVMRAGGASGGMSAASYSDGGSLNMSCSAATARDEKFFNFKTAASAAADDNQLLPRRAFSRRAGRDGDARVALRRRTWEARARKRGDEGRARAAVCVCARGGGGGGLRDGRITPPRTVFYQTPDAEEPRTPPPQRRRRVDAAVAQRRPRWPPAPWCPACGRGPPLPTGAFDARRRRARRRQPGGPRLSDRAARHGISMVHFAADNARVGQPLFCISVMLGTVGGGGWAGDRRRRSRACSTSPASWRALSARRPVIGGGDGRRRRP